MKNQGCLLMRGGGGWILTGKVCYEIRKFFVIRPLVTNVHQAWQKFCVNDSQLVYNFLALIILLSNHPQS